MERMRKVKIAVAGVVLGLGVVVAVETPALASSCPVGTACVYVDINYTGAQGVIPYSGFGDGACHVLSSTFNNKVSSADNDYGNGDGTGPILVLYDASNCTGTHYVVENGKGAIFTWYNQGSNYNDIFSSFRVV